MRFVLIGQPNCGKSTLFNQVAGYRAETGNFSGTTIAYTESKVRVLGEVIDLVDLPGTYTLAGTNPAEREVLRYIVYHPFDVIINILDSSNLILGLNLTLEILELGRPMVVALNMMDEAARMGMTINGPLLSELLGVEVLPLIASKGRGVRNVFTAASSVAHESVAPQREKYGLDLENIITSLAGALDRSSASFEPEALAIKLLEGNSDLITTDNTKQVKEIVKTAQDQIEASRGQLPVWVFNAERHSIAANIRHQIVHQGERRLTFRDRLDDILLHPFWGYVSLVAILWVFFQVVYGLGSVLEGPLLNTFDNIGVRISQFVGSERFITELVTGALQGVAGGVAIVLPYLLPFLFILGLLEDIGYLPRLAFLMDTLMHKIGLHGKAIVPFILGYGCNVPAVMSTRMLEDKRDKFLAATLATLVPCAARLAVVFGLVAFYLGPQIALLIYLFNLLVIAITGRVLTALMPEVTPGLILEIPVYRMPTLRSVAHKVWFRAKEFIVDAWPLLIAGSIVLSLLDRFNYSHWFNLLIRPVTWVLGLPEAVGVPLIFGILRKELSLIMLRQALNVSDFSDALSPEQMITFTVFVVFYIPCLATLSALRKELGTRDTIVIGGFTVVIAIVAAVIVRGLYIIIT